jgi:hypothetical protein
MAGMIQATAEAEQVLSSNTAPVKFTDIDLRTQSANCFNGWLNYNQGTANFNIVAGGIYRITFNANVTSDTIGDVGLALFADGVQLNGTEMDVAVPAAGDYLNISFNKVIRVCGRGSVSLTVASVPTVTSGDVATATEVPTLKAANINIERLA